MPSKIVANEGVGINLPVYRFNAFLGHYQGFSVAVEISVKFLEETLHTDKVFLIFCEEKLKKTFVPEQFSNKLFNIFILIINTDI